MADQFMQGTRSAGSMGRGCTATMIIALVLLACLVVVRLRPDEPVAAKISTNSLTPSFEVQVTKPLSARPLAGLFGLLPAEDLGFDNASQNAEVGRVGPDRLELSAEGWDLIIEIDGEGKISAETRMLFTMELGGKVRSLCCRPADPADGYLHTTQRTGSNRLSGRFVVKFAKCENAKTGKAIQWPPAPLTVRGSFDRLPITPAEPAADR